METVEALVVGASETADCAQEAELETLCPAVGFERADVVGPWRVAVPLERPLRVARRNVRVNLRGAPERLRPSDKAVAGHAPEEVPTHCFTFALRRQGWTSSPPVLPAKSTSRGDA